MDFCHHIHLKNKILNDQKTDIQKMSEYLNIYTWQFPFFRNKAQKHESLNMKSSNRQ